MDRVQLVLVIHNHQPVGNFDAVFREVTERAYLPFLRVAADYPQVRFGLHTSGCLLEWMEQHGGEYLELVRAMVNSGQVELLGGGMYEPILPVLPRRDALWQLERMNLYVEELFGVTPRGMWCPERVWEPHLPEVIASAGLNYTLLDDFHFRSAAEPEKVETEYFRTSHAGHGVNLLPISQKLRYTMPFQPVSETIDYLRQLADRSEHAPLVVFGDDGEKFGNWPDTYEWVYGQGWLADFFAALSAAGDWLEVLQPSEAISRRQPAGDVFIPALSYAEMGEWTRLDPDAGDDAPPGHWRNFLHKYPESKQLLDRAVHLSNTLASPDADSLPADVRRAAETSLGMAECNCAYWHGVFGGIYLNYLRHALHNNAIQAESALHAALHSGDTTVATYPAGCELTRQYLIESNRLAGVLDSGHGLCLSRLDDRESRFCWTNVLTRRREHYHRKLVEQHSDQADDHASIHDRVVIKDDGLTDLLEFDDHQRVSFNIRGHSSTPDPRTAPGKFMEALRASLIFDDWTSAAPDIRLGGSQISAEYSAGPCDIAKSVSLDGAVLSLEASVKAADATNQPVLLCVEFNLSMLTDSAADRWIEAGGKRLSLNEPHLLVSQASLSLCDGWQRRRLRLTSSDVHRVLIYPVYTASSSEGGFERTYQGSCIVLLFRYDGAERNINVKLELEDLADEH